MRRGILILTLLLASALPASGKSIAEWVADLGSKDYSVRLAAQRTLMQMETTAVIAPIAAALPGFDYTARVCAMGVLQSLPPAKTRPLFRSLLRSDDVDLRTMGAVGLFGGGDTSGIRGLARDIRDDSIPETQTIRILVRLPSVRHPEIAAAVRDRLKTAKSTLVLAHLIRNVSHANDVAAIPLLLSHAEAPDVELRLRARAALYRLGRREILADLGKDLARPDGTYASLSDALSFLQATGEAPEPIKKALVTRLEAGDDALSAVRVLNLLAGWSYRPAVPVAEKLIEDEDERVQKAAFALVTKLAGRSGLDALRRTLANGSDPIRLLAAEALRRFDDETGLAVVLEIVKSSDATDRREAVRVLGGFRRREAIPVLIEALADTDRSVASHALTGLQQVLTGLFPYRRFDWVGLRARAYGPLADRKKLAAMFDAWWKSLPKE